MSEFRSVLPFPETRAEQRPRSNGAVCRAMPVWIPGILNVRSIQILATVARFRGCVRSRRSGSMPLIVGERMRATESSVFVFMNVKEHIPIQKKKD